MRSKKPNVMGRLTMYAVMVYDAIVAQVHTYNLIAKISRSVTLTDVPKRYG